MRPEREKDIKNTETGGARRPSLFRCPVCGEGLLRTEGGLVCANGHSFDRARSGYVNLLTGRPPKLEGDTREMVAARSAFLEKGYYAALRRELERISAGTPEGVLLDAGCGEGWFLENIAPVRPTAAIDLSKFAAAAAAKRLGAKRRENVEVAVASVYDMPLAPGGVSLIFSVFAPWCGAEFRRLLGRGGVLAVAVPGAEHLAELKRIIYDRPPHPEPKEHRHEGFELAEEKRVTYQIELESAEDALELFRMTPHSRSGEAHPERIASSDVRTVTADFDLAVYRRV